jgi:hypothetical protein
MPVSTGRSVTNSPTTLALIVNVDTAVLLKFQRDYAGVIAESLRILQKDPKFFLGYSLLTAGYHSAHRWDDNLSC